jgi:hypothetical protein
VRSAVIARDDLRPGRARHQDGGRHQPDGVEPVRVMARTRIYPLGKKESAKPMQFAASATSRLIRRRRSSRITLVPDRHYINAFPGNATFTSNTFTFLDSRTSSSPTPIPPEPPQNRGMNQEA